MTTPVTDWSFTDAVETVKLQTSTQYLLPHSVTTYCVSTNGQLYLTSLYRAGLTYPQGRSWNTDVARDPHVRIKIGDKLYEATMILIADRAQAIAVLGRNPETLENGPDGQEHVVGYDHVYRVFQRNITEYGGNQPSPSSAGLVPENKS